MTEAQISSVANWVTILTPAWGALLWIVTHNRFPKLWVRCRLWFFIVGAVFTAYGLYRFGWLNWLFEHWSIPVWAIILGAVPVVLCLWALLFEWWNSSKQPTCWDYREDVIHQVLWKWSYPGLKLQNYTIHAFCPDETCQSRLRFSTVDRSYSDFTTTYTCPNCGFSKSFEGHDFDVQDMIAIEIERRVNTGEYLKSFREKS